ncbi:ABC exporter membrane fusion protein [Aetokthonos hydrillicola Thurmond2011]|jgi:HlyD family secretion protein|uniref:ABC exporter membrane fusion protein n=1 Tax=Aetokthonos hydrillicola Thurmond2011 TaxID=2712845 RepID=A0AAP5M8P5_9CYAN|nr:ABC exporter membrane fusion protein [Aetokthonos hydrillicola]MBO3460391.1 ABC exporter membrane fusion protein [Aetokthonos hydrillicola CCALA 1050]MBW4584487.1 ABC exporter membrane fusion protein [Aetokthonos hydrillicola CCALA 1050]MDR9896450.1 ABC exporter membrane fusion protein [Aetokthonos hydrillicola Thurmond2011]
MSVKVLFKPTNRWLIGLVLAAGVISTGIVLYNISQFKKVSEPAKLTPVVKRITALGRLEPESEVIRLSAPLDLDGDRVAQILVKEGEQVKAGQVIAILNSKANLQDALQQAQKQLSVAEAKLAQVKAGAKTGEIQAQESTIRRLQAQIAGEIAVQNAAIARWQSEVRNTRAEYNRFQQLYEQGAISTSTIDNKRLAAETAQAQLNQSKETQNKTVETLKAELSEAKANLNKIAEVRPVDIQAAKREVENATASVKKAETALKQADIRSPMAGQILKIHARTGEKIGDAGIADLAETKQMVAVAEVYQTDIGKVKLGHKAVITGQAFDGELQGVVYHIGLQVNRQNVFSNQPGENLDRRVVEVKIRLNPEASKKVAGLTNLQVQTAIEL